MGLIIVTLMGALLGWLAAIVADPEERVDAAACVIAGVVGSLAGALLAGNVPLRVGIGPVQLLWAVLGSALAVVGTNLLRTSGTGPPAERFDKPTGWRHQAARPKQPKQQGEPK